MKLLSFSFVLCLVSFSFVLGCNSEGTENAAATLAGQAMAISECGGFTQADSRVYEGNTQTESDYCDAEKLHWSYNADTQTFSILNSRVQLNCCGEHDIKIEQAEDGEFVITETDYPQTFDGTTSRCHCMCVFDYELTATGISAEEISVTLQRDIEEENDIITVWQGTINLSAGEGSVVTSNDSAEISGCGI